MVKFLDLQKTNAPYTPLLTEAAQKIISSGRYLRGDYTEQFEKELAQYIGVKYAIGVGNGLDALRLILRGYLELGVMKKGDEVIVPANTYIASILAVSDCGLKPVFVEPDPVTYNLDISKIEENITPRTKAIMVVHLYGQACWDEKLDSLKNKYGLKIIEDNAQAIGAVYKGRKTGSLGDAAAFSFYPTKNLGALGDAGAVCTYEPELAQMVSTLANYGSMRKNIHTHQGFNSRMDEIQAAFLSIKLPHLDRDNAYRRKLAGIYFDKLKDSGLVLPQIIGSPESHVFHLFVIQHPERDRLKAHLHEHNIETQIHYPTPPNLQEAYNEYRHLSLPITEKLSRQCLSLPLNTGMREEEILEVGSKLV